MLGAHPRATWTSTSRHLQRPLLKSPELHSRNAAILVGIDLTPAGRQRGTGFRTRLLVRPCGRMRYLSMISCTVSEPSTVLILARSIRD